MLDISTEEQHQTRVQQVPKQVSNLDGDPVRIVMATHTQTVTTDLAQASPFFLAAGEQTSDPVRIQVTHFPKVTFEDEVCLYIHILAHCQIKEVSINEQPVLSVYGLRWSKLFDSAIRYLQGKEGGRFLFQRVIKLKEGENGIKVKVVDQEDRCWEKFIQIRKKVKQPYALQERWRLAIPSVGYNQDRKVDDETKKSITHMLNKAFYSQKRFWVVDMENLEKVIEEKNLYYYIDIPRLGIRDQQRIMVDVFLLVHVQESSDSFNFLASLVDFETGEILSTKEVFEEINPQGPSGVTWGEEPREHIYQNCCVLAAKFKEHFPICEGNIISLIKEKIEATICKDDGLKEKMKLIIYNVQNQENDFTVIAEAKVNEVRETYSLATLLGKLGNIDNSEKVTNWKVITR